jgi:hypothetical protein
MLETVELSTLEDAIRIYGPVISAQAVQKP